MLFLDFGGSGDDSFSPLRVAADLLSLWSLLVSCWSGLLPLCVLLLVIGMCRGGDHNNPGGNKSGPKPKMDNVSIAKRIERKASKDRTAQRKAAAAAAAVQEQEAEQQKALLRNERSEQPMSLRRSLGSERVATAKAAAAAAAADAAAAAAASSDPAHNMKKIYSFFDLPRPH